MTSRKPVLTSRGNRILAAVAVGWLVWLFAGAVGIGTARWTAGIVAGGLTYWVLTMVVQRSGQDGSDSSR